MTTRTMNIVVLCLVAVAAASAVVVSQQQPQPPSTASPVPSGHVIWNHTVEPYGSSGPRIEVTDETVVVGYVGYNGNNYFAAVTSYHQTTGEILWKADDLANRQLMYPRFSASGKTVAAVLASSPSRLYFHGASSGYITGHVDIPKFLNETIDVVSLAKLEGHRHAGSVALVRTKESGILFAVAPPSTGTGAGKVLWNVTGPFKGHVAVSPDGGTAWVIHRETGALYGFHVTTGYPLATIVGRVGWSLNRESIGHRTIALADNSAASFVQFRNSTTVMATSIMASLSRHRWPSPLFGASTYVVYNVSLFSGVIADSVIAGESNLGFVVSTDENFQRNRAGQLGRSFRTLNNYPMALAAYSLTNGNVSNTWTYSTGATITDPGLDRSSGNVLLTTEESFVEFDYSTGKKLCEVGPLQDYNAFDRPVKGRSGLVFFTGVLDPSNGASMQIDIVAMRK